MHGLHKRLRNFNAIGVIFIVGGSIAIIESQLAKYRTSGGEKEKSALIPEIKMIFGRLTAESHL